MASKKRKKVDRVEEDFGIVGSIPWSEVCHFIAQGVINIEEGHVTIEKDSKVHQAMTAFCTYVSTGMVGRLPVVDCKSRTTRRKRGLEGLCPACAAERTRKAKGP